MRKVFVSYVFLAVAGILNLTSCSKADDKYPVAGAKGEKGEQGIQGEKGESGASGIKARTQSVSDWVFDALTKQYFVYTVNTDLTTQALNTGIIQVFIKTGTDKYTAIPATIFPEPNKACNTSFSLYPQMLRIEMQYLDHSQSKMPGSLIVKTVIMSTDFAKTHPGLNTSDYEQLSVYLTKELN